ncbi:MAG: hypothetical protein GXO07_06290 [Crenarchaeota archaeon]|nr:hypothetical protein [Thermoproteota archaeon]
MASEAARELEPKAAELKKILGLSMNEKDLARAQANWGLAYVQSLYHLLKLGEEVSPGEAVYVFSGRVTEVSKHPSADKLKVTRVSLGRVAVTVVTNLQDVKEGEVRAVAMLPPADLRGVISWGMFSSGPLALPEGKPFPPYDKGAVGAQVEQIMREAIRIKK